MSTACKRFAANLRRLRHEAGLTQDELGEAADISGAWVSELERGNGNPTLETMEKLAAGLGAPLAELTDFREDAPTPEELRGLILQAVAGADARTLRRWHRLARDLLGPGRRSARGQ